MNEKQIVNSICPGDKKECHWWEGTDCYWNVICLPIKKGQICGWRHRRKLERSSNLKLIIKKSIKKSIIKYTIKHIIEIIAYAILFAMLFTGHFWILPILAALFSTTLRRRSTR